MKLYAWDEFWSRAVFPNPAESFDADYQQFVDSVSVRFDPVDRPADTEDRVYWSKRPLGIDNYLADGTLAAIVTAGTSQVLSITDLPADMDIHLFAVRYVTSTGLAYSPETTCWEFARTARKPAITPANYSAELVADGDDWADWFEPIPAFSMTQHIPVPREGGGIKLSHRVAGNPALVDGVACHGKRPLAPDYDWEIEFTYDVEVDTESIVSLAYPRYLTFGATSGQQHMAALQTKHGHGAWNEIYPATPVNQIPAGYSTGDAGASRLVPFVTHRNSVLTGHDPMTVFAPWRQDRARPVGNNVPSKCKVTYTAATKVVEVRHTDATLGDDALIYTLDTTPTNPADMLRAPSAHHYPFGIRAAFSPAAWIAAGSPINIRNVKITSACPQDYAEWTPGWGQAWTGRYLVPGKYDGNLGVNLDDPDHTLAGLGFYCPWHTQGDLGLGFVGPGNRFTTRLFAGYTAPVNVAAQEAAHPETAYAPYSGLGFPHWTARTGYQAGTFIRKTPGIDSPEGKIPSHVVFWGMQRAGTLKVRLLDHNDTVILPWQTVNAIEGAAKLAIPANSSTKTRAEFEIVYDGTDVTTYFEDDVEDVYEVTYPYSPQNAPNLAYFDATVPDTPSLFVGFGLWFDSFQEEPSVATGFGGFPVTLKGAGGVVYPFNIKQ